MQRESKPKTPEAKISRSNCFSLSYLRLKVDDVRDSWRHKVSKILFDIILFFIKIFFNNWYIRTTLKLEGVCEIKHQNTVL